MREAQEYLYGLLEEVGDNRSMPLERGEPGTVMMDFIRYINRHHPSQRIMSSLYLGRDRNDGDNSDHGHTMLSTETGEVIETEDRCRPWDSAGGDWL